MLWLRYGEIYSFTLMCKILRGTFRIVALQCRFVLELILELEIQRQQQNQNTVEFRNATPSVKDEWLVPCKPLKVCCIVSPCDFFNISIWFRDIFGQSVLISTMQKQVKISTDTSTAQLASIRQKNQNQDQNEGTKVYVTSDSLGRDATDFRRVQLRRWRGVILSFINHSLPITS